MDPPEEFHAPAIGDLDQKIASSAAQSRGQPQAHVPGHMHTSSYSFHTRNHSAQLQSPSSTPQLDLEPFLQAPPQLEPPAGTAAAVLRQPIGAPGPLLQSPGISIGLTPFLGASPFFRSQPQTAWLGQAEFPKREPQTAVESEPKRHRPEPKSPEPEPKLSEPSPEQQPPLEQEEQGHEHEQEHDDSQDSLLMEVPGDDYTEEMTLKWTPDDDENLRGLLESAERHKWAYISDRLFDKLNRRVPPLACQRKFKELWGEPESSTQLGSSLPYVAFRSGYRAFKDLTTVETLEEVSSD